jgi:hypothetical protein
MATLLVICAWAVEMQRAETKYQQVRDGVRRRRVGARLNGGDAFLTSRQLSALNICERKELRMVKESDSAIIFPNDRSVVSSVIVFRSSPEIGVFLGCRWRRCW